MPPSPHARRAHILITALDTFTRYGYARTTMGDLAKAAGLSRPALYLVFPGKDDLFGAVIQHLADTTLTRFRDALPTLPTLADKLHHTCESWGAHVFTLTTLHPDARDLFDLSSLPVRRMMNDLVALLAEILQRSVLVRKAGVDPTQWARILVYAMRGFNDTATDEPDLRRLISLQVDMVVATLAS